MRCTSKMNSVQYILQHRSLSDADKQLIKELGRPLPDLQITTKFVSSSRNYNTYFKKSNTYDKYSWMCGCEVTNKLFCFMCLLSNRPGTSPLWVRTGLSDLRHLPERASKHAVSSGHLESLMNFQSLGAVDIRKQLDNSHLQGIRAHNEQVDKNRFILRQMIQCLKFYGRLELGVHARSPEIFEGLLDFVFKVSPQSFSHVSNFEDVAEIKDELLDAMLQVCKDSIKEEIKQSNYVALELGEVIDHRVIVLRYVFKGQIMERFWGMAPYKGFTGEVLLEELADAGVEENQLIAQSCEDFYEVVKGKYPRASFVHSYFHDLNMVLDDAAYNKEMRVFFRGIEDFSNFFCRKSNIEVLNQIDAASKTEQSTWDFKNKAIEHLYENTQLIEKCLEHILDNCYNAEILNHASRLLMNLESEDFMYYLQILSCVTPHVELFLNQINSVGADANSVKTSLEELETRIIEVVRSKIINKNVLTLATHRNDNESVPAEILHTLFIHQAEVKMEIEDHELIPEEKLYEIKIEEIKEEEIIPEEVTAEEKEAVQEIKVEEIELEEATSEEKYEQLDECSSPVAKRVRLDEEESINEDGIKTIARLYCDVLIRKLKERFKFTGYVSAAALLSSDLFPSYKQTFPDAAFKDAVASYPFLDRKRLQIELSFIYTRQELYGSSASSLLGFICRGEMREGFSETYKLLDIICTTPMMTNETERCFYTLQKINNFVGKAPNSERIHALAMLSVEEKMMNTIPGLEDKVINIFAERSSRSDFKYM